MTHRREWKGLYVRAIQAGFVTGTVAAYLLYPVTH
jgi:hypothetical protein